MSRPTSVELYERLEASSVQMKHESKLLQTYRTALREVVSILSEQATSGDEKQYALDVAESALEQGELHD